MKSKIVNWPQNREPAKCVRFGDDQSHLLTQCPRLLQALADFHWNILAQLKVPVRMRWPVFRDALRYARGVATDRNRSGLISDLDLTDESWKS
jgi:hypothetical protein